MWAPTKTRTNSCKAMLLAWPIKNRITSIMLSIKNLHASVDGKEILRGINLNILPGEVHAIMGQTVPARAPFPLCWPAVLITK
jgi:ABC-type molybdenum transport system ATPase subunit/photorepair protein PhrA